MRARSVVDYAGEHSFHPHLDLGLESVSQRTPNSLVVPQCRFEAGFELRVGSRSHRDSPNISSLARPLTCPNFSSAERRRSSSTSASGHSSAPLSSTLSKSSTASCARSAADKSRAWAARVVPCRDMLLMLGGLPMKTRDFLPLRRLEGSNSNPPAFRSIPHRR